MKIINAVLLSALFSIIGFASMQGASATPGFSIDVTPGINAPGGVFLIDVGVSPSESDDNYGERVFVLYDPDDNSAIPSAFLSCLGYSALGGDTLWDWEDSELDNVGIFVDTGDVGSVLDLDFGNGDPSTSAGTYGTSGTVTIYDPQDGGTGNPPDGTLVWNEKPGDAADNTLGIGPYYAAVCAWEDTNDNGVFNSGTDNSGTDTQGFRVAKPVGGEILPINTTALFMAGISSNPMWALSALGVVAGTAFVILGMQVTRKNF